MFGSAGRGEQHQGYQFLFFECGMNADPSVDHSLETDRRLASSPRRLENGSNSAFETNRKPQDVVELPQSFGG